MAESKRDANQTIQIDLAEARDVVLEDLRARSVPPPLPPQPAAAPNGWGGTIAKVALFLALLAVAIGAGLAVGLRARGDGAAKAAASSSSSASVITVPPVDVR